MIKITCKECGKKLEAPAEAEGKKGRCPECRTVFVVSTFKTADTRGEVRQQWDLNNYVNAIASCVAGGSTLRIADKILQKEDLFRAYGKEINEKSGFGGMQQVCERIRNQLGSIPARALEKVWGGIGEWRG